MKHKTSFSLVFVSRIVIALAILFVALPVVGAQSSKSASVVETAQGAFSAAASVPGVRFVHTATAANINGHYTYVDHPLTNDNPNAILLVTQNWNPGGVGGIYNDHPIGVWYSSSAKKWAVFNQDFAAMPTGAAFNVLIPATGADTFVHTATAANIAGNHTYIDHPFTNNNPNAIVLVTQNWNPGGVGNRPAGSWQCDEIVKIGGLPNTRPMSLAVDKAGFPIIAYQDNYWTGLGIKSFDWARPAAALGLQSGNCDLNNAWQCEGIDGPWTGAYSAIAVNPSSGLATIAYNYSEFVFDPSELRVAYQRFHQVFLPLVMKNQ